MNLERDKFLTEAMGECWHDMKQYTYFSECIKCKMKNYEIEMYAENNFSTWEGFGKLWEWATKQEWWYNFKIGTHCGLIIEGVYEYFINPDEFADTLYHYLK